MQRNCQKVLPSHDIIKKFRAPVRSESGAPVRSEKRISKIEAGGHPRIVLLPQTLAEASERTLAEASN